MYETINKIIDKIVNPLVILLFAVTLIVFVWGVFTLYIAKGEDPESRKAGTQHILYGVIGMSIMIGVFAIMHFITNTLSSLLGPVSTPPTIP